MNKTKTYNIYWRDIEIGQFLEESIDMGYIDGKMISNNSKNAYQFIKTASELDIKSVMLNPQNGIRATLKDETDFNMNVLVLGIDKNMELSLKMIVGKEETIDWYLKNVPEEKLLTTKPIVNTGFWYRIKNMFK